MISAMPSPNVVITKADPIINSGNLYTPAISTPIIRLIARRNPVVRNSCIILTSFPALRSDSLAKNRKNGESTGTNERIIAAIKNKRANRKIFVLKNGKNRTSNPRRI